MTRRGTYCLTYPSNVGGRHEKPETTTEDLYSMVSLSLPRTRPSTVPGIRTRTRTGVTIPKRPFYILPYRPQRE